MTARARVRACDPNSITLFTLPEVPEVRLEGDGGK